MRAFLKNILLPLGLFLLSGISVYLFLTHSAVSEAPLLVGKSLPEAEAEAKRLGLTISVTSKEYDTKAPEGTIIYQDIEPGTKLKDAEIKVVLSRGAPSKSLSDGFANVLGKDIKEAKEILKRASLGQPLIIYTHSDTLETDRVIAEGDGVLVVSSGQYDVIYFCPSFEGMSKEDSIGLIEELGLKAQFVGSGDVIDSQMPKAGSLIRRGQTIRLNLKGDTDD